MPQNPSDNHNKLPLSIIIPTLNEEKYISRILNNISNNTLSKDHYEIIVSDSGSEDKTEQKVKLFQKNNPTLAISFVKAEIKGVSVARNTGANFAKGEFLVFLDADSQISPNFLLVNLSAMQKKKLDVGACYAIADSAKLLDRFFMHVHTLAMICLQFTKRPIALGAAIWSKSLFHQKLGGFSSDIKFCEDLEYVTQAKQKGSFGVLTAAPVIFSMRRFSEEGRWHLVSKTLRGFWHHLTHKSMVNNKIIYHFGKHK